MPVNARANQLARWLIARRQTHVLVGICCERSIGDDGDPASVEGGRRRADRSGYHRIASSSW
jgi:hypothetical protein